MPAIQRMDHDIKMFSLLNQQELDYCNFRFYIWLYGREKRDFFFVWICYSFTNIQKIINLIFPNFPFASNRPLESYYDHDLERILKGSEMKFKGVTFSFNAFKAPGAMPDLFSSNHTEFLIHDQPRQCHFQPQRSILDSPAVYLSDCQWFHLLQFCPKKYTETKRSINDCKIMP